MQRPLPAGKGAGTYPAPFATENSWLLCHSRRVLSTAGRSGWRRALLPWCPCRAGCPLPRVLQRCQPPLAKGCKDFGCYPPGEGLCSLSLNEEKDDRVFRPRSDLWLRRKKYLGSSPTGPEGRKRAHRSPVNATSRTPMSQSFSKARPRSSISNGRFVRSSRLSPPVAAVH